MTGLKFEKDKIREEILPLRLAIPKEEKEAADAAMVERFLKLVTFRFAETVLFYAPVRGEPDVTAAVEEALKRGKKVAFPACIPETSSMVFRFVESLSELKTGTYGIPEPPPEAPLYLPSPKKHDLCIVPALCFDKAGYRVGYGKGYYDRFLTEFGGTTVGFTMERFLRERLPRGKYDRSVDLILTEKGVRSVG